MVLQQGQRQRPTAPEQTLVVLAQLGREPGHQSRVHSVQEGRGEYDGQVLDEHEVAVQEGQLGAVLQDVGGDAFPGQGVNAGVHAPHKARSGVHGLHEPVEQRGLLLGGLFGLLRLVLLLGGLFGLLGGGHGVPVARNLLGLVEEVVHELPHVQAGQGAQPGGDLGVGDQLRQAEGGQQPEEGHFIGQNLVADVHQALVLGVLCGFIDGPVAVELEVEGLVTPVDGLDQDGHEEERRVIKLTPEDDAALQSAGHLQEAAEDGHHGGHEGQLLEHDVPVALGLLDHEGRVEGQREGRDAPLDGPPLVEVEEGRGHQGQLGHELGDDGEGGPGVGANAPRNLHAVVHDRLADVGHGVSPRVLVFVEQRKVAHC